MQHNTRRENTQEEKELKRKTNYGNSKKKEESKTRKSKQIQREMAIQREHQVNKLVISCFLFLIVVLKTTGNRSFYWNKNNIYFLIVDF